MGPLLTATTILALNALTEGEFVTHPVHLACVVYAVFRGGVGSGLVSSALVVSNALLRTVAVPFGLEEPFRQVNIFALACLVLVLVTGHLKRHADSASELSRANQKLAAMTRDLAEPLDDSPIHHRIVSTILELVGVRQAMLYQLDTASQEMTCVATAGKGGDTPGLGHRLPAVEAMQDSARSRIIPLRARGKVLGALTLDVAKGKLTREADLQLLSIFAGHAALALENSRLDEDLRATLEQLSGSHSRLMDEARLRATEELASGVAHHVNNRLMVILAGVQLLKPKLTNDHRDLLETVELATLDTARLVDRLRQFTLGRPKGVAESADLNLAVRRAVDLCRADHAEALARGHRVEIVLNLGSVPRVVAEEPLLEEALAHVMRNAIEAVADRGTVTVTTSAVGASVVCAVADTGVGMSEDVLQRAAEPFFTTKGPQRSGLGLSSAFGILRQLGGQIDIRSEGSQGTCVTVCLPSFAERALT